MSSKEEQIKNQKELLQEKYCKKCYNIKDWSKCEDCSVVDALVILDMSAQEEQ